MCWKDIHPFWHKAHLNKHYGFLNRNAGSLKPDKWLSGYRTGGSGKPVYANIKKICTLILSIALIMGFISVSPTTAFAASNSDRVNSIINSGTLSSQKASLISDDGTEYEVNIYESAAKLVSVDTQTNTESYMKECAFILDKDNMVLRTAGSIPADDWDKTGAVQGFVTVYFDKIGSDYKITRSTGSWENYDSSTTLSDRRVVVTCIDEFNTNQRIIQNVSSNSFNIYTGFTEYADSYSGIAGIGSNSIVKLHRGSATWEFVVYNQIAGHFSF